MKTQTISDAAHAFRAETRRDATTFTPRPDDRDAVSPGGFSQRELRDLVLHWMG